MELTDIINNIKGLRKKKCKNVFLSTSSLYQSNDVEDFTKFMNVKLDDECQVSIIDEEFAEKVNDDYLTEQEERKGIECIGKYVEKILKCEFNSCKRERVKIAMRELMKDLI